MERGSVPAADFEDKMFEQNLIDDPFQQPSNKSSKPLIAGILLMIAGGLTIHMWLSLAAVDVSFIETFIMTEVG